MLAYHELAVKYTETAVIKLSAHGKYMGNILQPHNTPWSLHQVKQVFGMNLCKFKGLTNSEI